MARSFLCPPRRRSRLGTRQRPAVLLVSSSTTTLPARHSTAAPLRLLCFAFGCSASLALLCVWLLCYSGPQPPTGKKPKWGLETKNGQSPALLAIRNRPVKKPRWGPEPAYKRPGHRKRSRNGDQKGRHAGKKPKWGLETKNGQSPALLAVRYRPVEKPRWGPEEKKRPVDAGKWPAHGRR